MVNSTNNTVWVGQQINLTNMVLGSATNSAVTSYHWAIPGANNTKERGTGRRVSVQQGAHG